MQNPTQDKQQSGNKPIDTPSKVASNKGSVQQGPANQKSNSKKADKSTNK